MGRTFLIILLLTFGCTNSGNNLKNKTVKKDTNDIHKNSLSKTNFRNTDTCLLGDINADKKNDTAFVVLPKFVNPEDPLDGGCVNNNCEVSVKFSNRLPPFTFGQAISAGVYNIGDIDKDSVCEIMFCPGWFIGCWGTMRFYSLKNNTWNEFGLAKGYMCVEEDPTKRVKIINNHTIEVVEDSLYGGGDMAKKTKRITL
jgi:hypothetical protein